MKHLKQFAPLLLLAVLVGSCKKDEDKTTETTTTTVQNHGKVTLTYAGHTLVTEGACTVEYDLSHPVITVTDATVPGRKFQLALNDLAFPTNTVTLPLITQGAPQPGTAFAIFRNEQNGNMWTWKAEDGAGSVTLNIASGIVACSFENIPLQPEPGLNTGDEFNEGTVTGQFILDTP